ncbi:unnamed protein product [Rotaria sordida]|uniref:Metallo-beta-lactamase domain-containing protein n=1 Tax=Rotaria sordida TaxID=392033 RepID=A0A813PW84_9BILA|nr:unnamed protein product [Rotaria sordida]CAF0781883.1 unnamed protein product [Rotaria sordida]
MSTVVQNTKTSVRRLYVLLCEFEILSKTISTRNLGVNIIMSEPMGAYFRDTTKGWILVDSDIDNSILAKKYFVDRGWTPLSVVLPMHRLKYQLSLIGIEPEMINYIILIHTHTDHTGNLKYFPTAKIYIQCQEYGYVFQSPEKLSYARFRDDYDNRSETDWLLIDGDTNILSSLNSISIRGHTLGHQSVLVLLPSGTSIIMTDDAGDLLENYEKEILPGESVDDTVALKSIRRLKQLASLSNAHLFLCHYPILIQTLKLTPDYYD